MKLSKYASKDLNSIRLKKLENDIRTNYFRDIDKILYSKCYSRYIDKTQVFSFVKNDHISKRIMHVQLVSKIARTIGRNLKLNEDLIEAISLGHDVGHVPFGHVGESILNKISIEKLNEPFLHNVQSVRNLMVLEKNGKGLNLSIQVLDGILCHNGEKLESKYEFKEKTKEEFFIQYEDCYKEYKYSRNLIPMTLEACVVRLSDVIAYLGKDIEDAITLGIITKNDIPFELLNYFGQTNSDLISKIVDDVITNSQNKPYIKLSDECLDMMNKMLSFNYNNIYNKAYTKEEKEKMEYMFNTLYNYYEKDFLNNEKSSILYKKFLYEMDEEYNKNTKLQRKIIDYISGMTDEYFLDEFNSIKLD